MVSYWKFDGEESVKEPEPNASTDDSLLATRIGALLDFYSDRAVAHASFFVASLFGLVTMCAIIQQIPLEDKKFVWISILLFLAFAYLGYYSLVRFNFYADISERLTYRLNTDETLGTTLKDYMNEQTMLQKKILFLKTIIDYGKRPALVGLYWGTIVCMGLVVYSKFWKTKKDWIWFVFVMVALIILVVFAIPWFLLLQ